MSMRVRLPKGCPSSRGASDIRHITSQGGSLPHHTNRLYMLTVRRESLMNKRQTLEVRLREIKGQLEGIEADIRATENQYRRLQGNGLRKNRSKQGSAEERSHGRSMRTVPLEF